MTNSNQNRPLVDADLQAVFGGSVLDKLLEVPSGLKDTVNTAQKIGAIWARMGSGLVNDAQKLYKVASGLLGSR